MENTYFKPDAKTIVDMLFDNGIFRENITRDDMNSTETFIQEMMQMRFDSHLRLKKLTDKINNK